MSYLLECCTNCAKSWYDGTFDDTLMTKKEPEEEKDD
jgi:hypothetical protein